MKKSFLRFLTIASFVLAPLSAESGLKWGCGIMHDSVKGISCNTPTFSENYLSGSLGPSDTFTRASSASQYNSSGTLIFPTSNVPRFDYNPATLALNGLLIEQSSTNLTLHSALDVSWNEGGGASVSINSATSPDGAMNAALMSEGAGLSEFYIYYGAVAIAAQNETISVSGYLKSDSRTAGSVSWVTGGLGNGFYNNTNLSTGVVSSGTPFGTGTAGAASIQALTGGWYRSAITGMLSSSSSSGFGYFLFSPENPYGTIVYTGSSQSAIYVYGAQVEVNAVPTSYIPTTTTSATRAIDSLKVTSIPWFNAATGTLYVTAMIPIINPSRSTTIASFNDGTASNQIKLILNSSGVPEAQIIIAGTTYTSGGSLSAITPGTPFTLALSYKSGANLFSANGVADTAGTFGAASLPSGISQLTNGDDGAAAQTLNGWMQSVKYYNNNQTQAQLNAGT